MGGAIGGAVLLATGMSWVDALWSAAVVAVLLLVFFDVVPLLRKRLRG